MEGEFMEGEDEGEQLLTCTFDLAVQEAYAMQREGGVKWVKAMNHKQVAKGSREGDDLSFDPEAVDGEVLKTEDFEHSALNRRWNLLVGGSEGPGACNI